MRQLGNRQSLPISEPSSHSEKSHSGLLLLARIAAPGEIFWKGTEMERDQIETILKSLVATVNRIDTNVKTLLEAEFVEDEEMVPQRSFGDNRADRFIEEDEIYKHGQKIPYNRITDPNDMDKFRDFVAYVQLNEHMFSQKEIDYARFSDKNFSDIRLSDNTRRILGMAYNRVHKRQWAFNFERGVMHKYQGQIAWSWSDGSRD